MMDWTDRHCRFFHRLLTRHTRLYTEMVTTGALLHGDQPRHLDFNPEEHPLALQLGGSEPDDLAQCARLAERWGYDEINLNCGCPSERVQRGAFGACLMKEPQTVADSVKAMRAATSLPVTVKHRIGLGRDESYAFVRDFVGVVAEAGCEVFIVHARNAWLEGLSPKENREVPPLRHDVVRQLKREFAQLTIVANGGLASNEAIDSALLGATSGQDVFPAPDGVMIGRWAYHEPWALASWDERHFGLPPRALVREAVEEQMVVYMAREQARTGQGWYGIARHMLGLWHGMPGARRWRQVWSDHRLKQHDAAAVAELARRARLGVPAEDLAATA